MTGPILHVSLWARPGRVAELAAYEDAVLALLGEHGGHLLARVRPAERGSHPNEIQLISFDTSEGYEAYLVDPRRTGRASERDAAIERTEMYRVTHVV